MFVLLGALIIGLALGMLGSGGSALTVPVLLYMVGHGAKESIAESLAIVGLISLAAAVPYARSQQIDWRSVLYFGVPGMFGTFVGAWLGGLATAALQLVVFGGVLVAAAVAMFAHSEQPVSGENPLDNTSHHNTVHRAARWKIAIEGSLVGILTGFVGVGGGFLIVPALVVLGKLPMRLAIGSSLLIIGIKAIVGFAKYEHYLLAHGMSVNWQTILIFSIVGIVGSLLGRSINTRMDARLLRHVFAVFLVVVGGFVIFNEGRKLIATTFTQGASHAFEILL